MFQEWQMETNPPNYNFTHNGVANNFIEQKGLEDSVIVMNELSDDNINMQARYYASTPEEVKAFEKGVEFSIHLMNIKQQSVK